MVNEFLIKSKKAKENNVSSIIFCVLQVVQLFMIYSLATENIMLERLCSYAIFGCGFVLIATTMLFKGYINGKDILFIVFVLYILAILLISKAGSNVFEVALYYVLMLSVWTASREIKLSKTAVRFLSFLVFAQSIMLVALYFSPYAYEAYTEYANVSEELTLGFDNPNQTGIILYATVCNMLILFRLNINKILKFLYLPIMAALIYFLVLTKARVSLLSMIFIIVYYVVVYVLSYMRTNKKWQIKPHSSLIFLLIISSLIFVFVYMYMYKNNIFTNVKIMDKELFSGREHLYQNALNRWENKLIGNIEVFSLQNSHNGLLTVLINTGVIGLILYVIHAFINLNEIYKKYCLNVAAIGFVIIMGFFVNAWAEAAGLVGGTIYYINLLTVCVLTNKESEAVGIE